MLLVALVIILRLELFLVVLVVPEHTPHPDLLVVQVALVVLIAQRFQVVVVLVQMGIIALLEA